MAAPMSQLTEEDAKLASKCLEICQTLAIKSMPFSISINIGPNFSFSVDTMGKKVLPSSLETREVKKRKKKAPSALRRNARRRAEFLRKKLEASPAKEPDAGEPEVPTRGRDQGPSNEDEGGVFKKVSSELKSSPTQTISEEEAGNTSNQFAKKIKCDACDDTFNMETDLEAHKKAKHNTSPPDTAPKILAWKGKSDVERSIENMRPNWGRGSRK